MATPTPATLAEFKAELNKSGSDEDDELQLTLEAATLAVENWHGVGPIVVRPFTERVTVTRGRAMLTRTPAVAVTSMAGVILGDVVDVSGLDLDGDTGVIRSKYGYLPSGDYTVTYTAGREEVPEALIKAVLIIGKHLWESQRGPRTKLRGESEEESRAQWTGAGYLIPNRAAHLMQPYATVPVG